VHFFNEDHDTPSTPPPYGLAGWTKDDRQVLIYDRYDIWQVSPDGSGARNLTDGIGRKDETQMRYVRLDPRSVSSIRQGHCCCTPKTKTPEIQDSIATGLTAACRKNW